MHSLPQSPNLRQSTLASRFTKHTGTPPLGWDMATELADALLFRPSPRPMHAWRAFLLRCFGAKIGAHVPRISGARIWAPLESRDATTTRRSPRMR